MKETPIDFLSDELIIQDNGAVRCVKYNEIVCIHFDKGHTIVTTYKKGTRKICYSLTKLIQKLPVIFSLCSRSSIVNLIHIRGIEVTNNNCILYLNNEIKVNVSQRKEKEIKSKFISIKKQIPNCNNCYTCETSKTLKSG